MATLKGKWLFNETLTEPTFQYASIDFLTKYPIYRDNLSDIKGTSFDVGVNIEGNTIITWWSANYGENKSVYTYGTSSSYFLGWKNEGHRTIVFLTEQTVSDEFYAWFIANAEPLVTRPVTDLTGTSWTISSEWFVGYGYLDCDVYGSVAIGDDSSRRFDGIRLGCNGGGKYEKNSIAFRLVDNGGYYAYSNSSSESLNIAFEAETDAPLTPGLIAWLYAFGELVSGGEEDELYLIDESTLTEIADAIRTKKGIAGYLDPANFASEILSIGQAPTTPNLISFTIDGKTYQAEEGMTWEDWLISSYNKDGFEVYSTADGNYIDCGREDGRWKILQYSNTTVVYANEPIVGGEAYVTKLTSHASGGGSA